MVFHETVPDLDFVIAINDDDADVDALDNVEQPVQLAQIDTGTHDASASQAIFFCRRTTESSVNSNSKSKCTRRPSRP